MQIEKYPNFEPQGFSLEIFKDRYAFTEEEKWSEACMRVANQMALAETPTKVEQYKNKFYDILVKNLFVPGGRIWYYSGRNNPQLLNCFVLNNNLDSKEGWGNIAKEMIVTSMTGGGCGIDFSDVRPNGALIRGTRGTCSGPVSLMELIDGCAKPIRAGGSRRVALMYSLDLHHPDIVEFLDAKLEKGKLTYANVSVKSHNTKDFINAIKENRDIELSWKGQYKKSINAKELWENIVSNAYNHAEPGFLNWELVNKENTLSYVYDLVTTNPCGEQCLPAYGNCCLGHLVLSRFIDKNKKVDWESLGITIRLAVRFLDNVLSVNSYPLPEMKEQSHKERRIGLGVTALADMLAILGYRYGSKESIEFLDKLFRFISKQAYEGSVMLAVEKGPFPLCIPEEHIKTGYVSRMTPKIRSLISENGIRNSCLLTVAPTGTVSILSNNCSSGIEPIFSYAYERRFFKDNERKTELVFHPLFANFMELGENVSHFVSSHELSVREHLEIQKIVQNHIDNAVSKTINLPEDYSIYDMSDIWLEYLPFLKGTTFYRNNTRGYVDEKGIIHEPPLVPLDMNEAKIRFKENHIEGTETDCENCEI